MTEPVTRWVTGLGPDRRRARPFVQGAVDDVEDGRAAVLHRRSAHRDERA
ncbi:hypothetical protein [Mycobacterium kyogaense]|nr:hypothetical protein [Mycobacterium kyogaense]